MQIPFFLPIIFLVSAEIKFKAVWISIFFLQCVAQLVHGIVYSYYNYFSSSMTLDFQTIVGIFIGNFTMLTTTGVLTIIGQYYAFKRSKSLEKNILYTTSCIKELKFDSKKMERFLQQPDEICSSITKLLKQIVYNMISYKPYLPHHLLEGYSSDESTKDDESNASSTSSGENNQKKKKVLQKKTENYSSGIISNKVHTKFGTFLLVKLDGWREKFEDDNNNDEESIEFYSKWVDLISNEIAKTSGCILRISNDKIIGSWNIKTRCTQCEEKACTSALNIKKQLDKIKISEQFSKFANSKISICSGKVKCGNMGSEKMKTYNFFGGIIPHLYAINRILNDVDQNLIVLDSPTNFAVKYRSKTFFINQIVLKKDKKIYIYLLKELKTLNESEEWMYSISSHLVSQENETKSIEGKFNQLKYFFEKQEYVKIQETLEECAQSLDNQLIQNILATYKLKT